MKIAQVTPAYYPNIGGIETHVREIAERLSERHEVDVITADLSPSLKKTEHKNGVNIIRFPSILFKKTLFFSPSIRSYLRVHQYDIIHAHNYHAFPALLASITAGNNFIFNPHYHGKGSSFLTDLLLKPYHVVGKGIFEKARKVICDSEYEQHLVTRDFDLEQKDTIVIPSGIQLKKILSAEPYPTKEPLILYVGRLDRYKNIDLIIQTMPFLPDFKLYIIGKSGRYKQHLFQLIRRLDLTDRIKILDHVSDDEKYRWLKTCSLFINLSDTEAFGISVLEAMAAGRSIIVDTTGGLQDFVRKYGDEVIGIDKNRLKDQNSLSDFAQLIQTRAGLEFRHNLSEYDWDTIHRKIEREYLNIT